MKTSNICLANPPLIKPHGESHKFHCPVSHERNPNNVKKFLILARIRRQKGAGVFC